MRNSDTNGKPNFDFRRAKSEIVARLDLAAEAAALGLRFSSTRVNAKGFRPCYAAFRDDKNPSAAINVKTGTYLDSGSDGKALSFWDFASRIAPARFPTWKDALYHFADVAGVPLPKKGGGRTAGNPAPAKPKQPTPEPEPPKSCLKIDAEATLLSLAAETKESGKLG